MFCGCFGGSADIDFVGFGLELDLELDFKRGFCSGVMK
jgi:hypothetical protein